MPDTRDSRSAQALSLDDLLMGDVAPIPTESVPLSKRAHGRMTMLNNGFTPLPASDKGCYLPQWSKVQVLPEVIRDWERKHPREKSTGLRTGDDIIAVDIDVLGEPLADRIHAKVRELCGAVNRPSGLDARQSVSFWFAAGYLNCANNAASRLDMKTGTSIRLRFWRMMHSSLRAENIP